VSSELNIIHKYQKQERKKYFPESILAQTKRNKLAPRKRQKTDKLR
jgi:hypothetical protein